MDIDEIRQDLQDAAANSARLQVAFIGLTNDLLETLQTAGPMTATSLAKSTDVDDAYLDRWLDAAYGFELVDRDGDQYALTELGAAFLPEADQSLYPLAIESVLSVRLTDRLSDLVDTGEQPGESILEKFDNVIPHFGRMLEGKFRPYFRQNVLPDLNYFQEINDHQGTVLDLGCGNGWCLRALASEYDELSGFGIDTMEPNIDEARQKADKNELDDRLDFYTADIFEFHPDNRFDAVVLTRTLHHVWNRREELFETIDNALTDDGRLVVWEPAFPSDADELRDPERRMLGMRNLAEHAMGNRLLEPADVQETLDDHGFEADVHQLDDVETLFVASRNAS